MKPSKRFQSMVGILAGLLAGGVACQSPSRTAEDPVAPAAEVQARLVYFAIPG